MSTKLTNGIRAWTWLTPATDKQLEKWAARLGITKSALINLCLQAGISQVIRTVAPEELFTPKQWALMAAEMVKTGRPITLPDGTVVGGEEKPTRKTVRK